MIYFILLCMIAAGMVYALQREMEVGEIRAEYDLILRSIDKCESEIKGIKDREKFQREQRQIRPLG